MEVKPNTSVETAKTSMLLVSGERSFIRNIPNIIQDMDVASKEADDIIKKESVGLLDPIVRTDKYKALQTLEYFEVALNYHPEPTMHKIILTGFLEYAKFLDVECMPDLRFSAGNLLFIPVRATKEQMEVLAKYAFVRVIRIMPKLRGIPSEITRS